MKTGIGIDRSTKHAVGGALFILMLLGNAYFYPVIDYDNSRSRLFLLSAMVDRGTFDIGPYARYTIDKAAFEGRYYSNKAIGSPMLGVPFYWAFRQLPLRANTYGLNWPSRYFVTVMTTGLLGAVCAVVMWYLALAWGAAPLNAILMILAYGFGTIAWIHATMFSGHLMAAALMFIGFAVLWHIRKAFDSANSPPAGPKHALMALMAGLIVGFAGLCDYTALLLCPLLAGYVLVLRIPWKPKMFFFSGAALCAGLLIFYNWQCFGSPLSSSYAHNAFKGFSTGSQEGLLGIRLPDPAVLLKILFSPSRGLFFIMPVLLFGVLGFYRFFRQRELRLECGLFLLLIGGNLAINAGFYGWHGGWTLGPRYLVVMLPFMAFAMVFTNLRNLQFGLLMALSFLQVFVGVAFCPYVPEQLANPLLEFLFPLVKHGYTAVNLGILCGFDPATALAIWCVPMTLLVTFIFCALARDRQRASRESAPPRLRIWERATLLLAAALVGIGLVSIRTDDKIVAAYQNRYMQDFNNIQKFESIYRVIKN